MTAFIRIEQAKHEAKLSGNEGPHGGRPLRIGKPHKHCQYIPGDDGRKCGKGVAGRSSYCQHHHEICYTGTDNIRDLLRMAS